MATDNQTIINIYSYGYNKSLVKDDDFYSENAQVVSSITSGIAASSLLSGETSGNMVMIDGEYKSSDYELGVSGWIIRYDGFAQFSDITLIGGALSYGKTSFADAVNSGYFLSSSGVHIGSSTRSIKFTIADGTFLLTGIDLTWANVTGTGKPADNATVGATLGVNVAGGSTSNNYINNNGYITSITATSITTGTLTVGSGLVGITVNTGGDIVMNSVDGTSFSSILFRKASSGWDMSYVGSGGGGYNDGDLLFEPQANGQYFSVGSLGLTTIGIYTHFSVYGNSYLRGNVTTNDILPRTDNTYYIGSSSAFFKRIYANRYYFGTNYLQDNGDGRMSTNCDIIASGSLHATGNIYTGGLSGNTGSVNLALLAFSSSATNPSTQGEIRHYVSGATKHFRAFVDSDWVVANIDLTAV
jgi:hypothetical protein